MPVPTSIQVKRRLSQKTPPIRKKKKDRAIVEPSPIADDSIAYAIDDANFGRLEVQKSSNAWWIDRTKVERLIATFKLDATILEACFSAGITERQYKYFVEIHPDFCTIKDLLSQCPILKARETLVNSLSNPQYALAYLDRKRKEEFSTKTEIKKDVKIEKPIPDMTIDFPPGFVEDMNKALAKYNRMPLFNGSRNFDSDDSDDSE